MTSHVETQQHVGLSVVVLASTAGASLPRVVDDVSARVQLFLMDPHHENVNVALQAKVHDDEISTHSFDLQTYLPPISSRLTQDKSMECVLMVLTGVREDQIETCLSGLSLDELDILVKYVYKGLGMPRNNGPLFKWHAKVCRFDQPPSVQRMVSSFALNERWQVSRASRSVCFRDGSYVTGYEQRGAARPLLLVFGLCVVVLHLVLLSLLL